jgi:predicted alpha-1,6-mannanase (GH76 family)
LDVLVDGYNRTNDKQYLSLMKELLRGIKIKNWGTYWKVYVDDMCWLGIACMNAWHASHDEEYKNTAIYILNEIKKAHTDVLGGGLQWRFDGPNAKHACSTGPGGILALRLYEAEKKEEDLIFAKELYQWETATLLNPSNYLVWDNIFKNEAGVIEIKKDWMYTYNVGTYVGMAKDLYLQTGDKKYLEAAVRSALASISSSDMVANNMFKETGDHDGGLFKGILVRYLTEMVFTEGVTETFKKSVVRFLKSNANVLYNKGTSPPPAVFASSDWSIRPEKSHDLSTQLSAMMLVESMAKFDKSGLLTP